MIIPQHLLTKLVISTLCLSSFSSFANCSKEMDVLVRGRGSSFNFEKKELKELKCNDTFEGTYFKVVDGISGDAIKFSDSEDLLKRAATVYYHASQARSFWVNTIKSKYVENMEQVILRVNMAREYSRTGHFKRKDTATNNARSIPAGQTPRRVAEHKKKSWGREIWFRPKKIEDIREKIEYANLGSNPVTQSLHFVEKPIMNMTESNFIYESLNYINDPVNASQTPELIVISSLYTVGMTKGIVWMSKFLDYVFVEDEFYIDAALVPDIIHHEFAHMAMSETLKPTHSLPVLEGMADYFTASAMKRAKLYERMDDILLARSKDAENKKLYNPLSEYQLYADRDFALSTMWKVRQNLEELNTKRREVGKKSIVDVDQLIYYSRHFLNEGSRISPDLTHALVKSCQKLCTNRRAGVDAIRRALEEKGFN